MQAGRGPTGTSGGGLGRRADGPRVAGSALDAGADRRGDRTHLPVRYTVAGVCCLLHRLGWSWQAPTRRAAERDEQAIAVWKDEQWPIIKGWQHNKGRGCASKTRPDRA
ncbi:winged helix-turn-helix domain-containing protein [Nonomuraea sp. NPDC049152]|uniref:helix-turn-helix domain-containing protein n=1 Tax=Nonomuraea sp. NPDC049152 TaxID=3154350 RepID=UPI0034054D04